MTTENKKGYFGEFGGSYVPEVVQKAFRETPLYFAESLTNYLGGAKIYLKCKDLNHLGAHILLNI